MKLIFTKHVHNPHASSAVYCNLSLLKINHPNRYIFASNNYILFFVYTFLQKGYLRIPIQDFSDEKDDPLPPQSIGKFNSKTDASLCFL